SRSLRAGPVHARPDHNAAMRCAIVCAAVVLAAACGDRSTRRANASPPEDWPVYGHDAGGTLFSPVRGIHRATLSNLVVAWVAHTGETITGPSRRRIGFESTPIVLDGTLYFTTGTNRIIALDPETGVKRWEYDPRIDVTTDYGDGLINRGVVSWT